MENENMRNNIPENSTQQGTHALRMPPVFSSRMVLQREKPLCFWGSAEPGVEVRVTVQGQTAATCADGDGNWSVWIGPLTASERETVTVSSGTQTVSERETVTVSSGTQTVSERETVTVSSEAQTVSESEDMTAISGSERVEFTDVAVGEVWIAGGQSNMEYHMRYEKHIEQIRNTCSDRLLRFYDVPEIAYEGQAEQFDYSEMGKWRLCDPENIEYFSAAGYYFACRIREELHVPVGIVGCNWGGTMCASWMDPETVRAAGPDWMADYEAFAAKTDMEKYFEKQRYNPMNSRGMPFSERFGEFFMPKTRTQEEIERFFAEEAVLQANVVSSVEDCAQMDVISSIEEASLADDVVDWMPPHIPGSLYTHMVSTIAPMAARGVLWYQGESDDQPGKQQYYQAMLTGMIGDWRRLWQDELPFLIVQLPGFERWIEVDSFDYAAIREAQEKVTREVPGTWLCSISDAGEQLDIHPKNKKVVGERLALLAEAHVYGCDVQADAPAAVSASIVGDRVEICFENACKGLSLDCIDTEMTSEAACTGQHMDRITPENSAETACTGLQFDRNRTAPSATDFCAALSLYKNGREIEFRAEIRGSRLLLTASEPLKGQICVNFAKENWYLVNLRNSAGIPAIPFRFSVACGGEDTDKE